MATVKKLMSFTCLVSLCMFLGGVAVPVIYAQTTANVTTPDTSNDTTEPTTLVSNATTEPSTPFSNATTEPSTPFSNATTPSNNDTSEPTTPFSNVTTAPEGNNTTINTNDTTSHTTSGNPTSPPSSTPNPRSTTPPDTGRKFDVASFFGGFAAAVGVTIIVFVIARFYCLSRKTRYHAM